MRTQKRFEVIVIGGGLVGATAACILAQGGVDVALFDSFNPQRKWTDNSVDFRVSALTKSSQNILQMLAVWEAIKQHGLCPYKNMQVWDSKTNGVLNFDCAETQFTELGHIVENRITIAALWDKLETLPAVTCISDAKVTYMYCSNQGRVLQLNDGREFIADLIVAADGQYSSLRTMAGIGVTRKSYQQTSIVATISTEKSHQFTAWQGFLTEGPLAFLPLRTGQCSMVWTLKTQTAQAYLQLNEADFLLKLERAFGDILGKITKADFRHGFPLYFQYANNYTATNFALIGDAAHTIHPLAGQGANIGLLDAAALAELVIKTKRSGKSLSGTKFLRQYERWRKGDNLLMLTGLDAINKTFLSTFTPLVLARSAGINLINKTPILKAFFNDYAMGLRDDLPLLAKKQICW